ncbi:MAG TPA: MFS transporter [Candidatus Binatia bacterium]|nr:MFS transporter [Candidatus Binatia bacterium]
MEKPLWFPLSRIVRLRAFQALGHREYRLLWYSQVFASLGVWMDQVTRGWLIYELTDSALQLGMVRGIQAIPFLFLSPVAGSVADRYPRKFLVVTAQFANAFIFTATAALILFGLIRPWHVYLTALLMACVQVFLQPARAAMISDTVPPENLTNAIGLNAVVFNMARSTGPALAGVLISGFNTGVAYGAQGLFFLLATVWTTQMRSGRRAAAARRSHGGGGESFARSIVSGWQFSWRKEEVRSSLLIVMVASLFMVPFSTLLPIFARDILEVGAQGQGLLLASMGVGALGSALIIATFGDRMPRGIMMLAGVTLYGVLVVLFSASPWFSLSMVLMAIIGLCHVSSHALVQTVIQSYSPPEFRGRAIAMFHMNQILLLLGGLGIGALSAAIGAPWAAAALSIAGTLCMVALYIFDPRARKIR